MAKKILNQERTTNEGRLQIPHESLSFSGEFGGSKPSLNSP